jgi:hypothetical protein
MHPRDRFSDDELYDGFESGRLPKEAFHHREHVRAAFLYLSRYPDLAESALHFRSALRRFAEGHGVAGLLHETLTWAYLVLIQERMHGHRFETSQQFLASSPDLLDHRGGLLARYYDVGSITASRSARHLFVLPGGPTLERKD